jgi:hypothetical protein
VAVVTYLATTTRDGRATWEACSVNLEYWEPSQHLLIDAGKPRKTCAEMADLRTCQILTKYILYKLNTYFRSDHLKTTAGRVQRT